MLFFFSTLLLAVFSSPLNPVMATPTPVDIDRRADFFQTTDQPQDLCGDSTFVNTWSDSLEVNVDDCNMIKEQSPGYWEWFNPTTAQTSGDYFWRHGRCTFGITFAEVWNTPEARMGDTDVRDLILDSVAKFAKNGKVRAKGTVVCYGARVNWVVQN